MTIEELINNIYEFFLNSSSTNNNINLIRKHTKKITTLGELSLPLNILSWRHVISNNEAIKDVHNILEFASSVNNNTITSEDLISKSLLWSLSISKIVNIKNNMHIFLVQPQALSYGIRSVLLEKCKYGSSSTGSGVNCIIQTNLDDNSTLEYSLSDLRLFLLKEVTVQLLLFSNYSFHESGTHSDLMLNFTRKPFDNIHLVNILSGPVVESNGSKQNTSVAADYYKQRTIDMRLMAEHKYGVRIKSQVGWEDFFTKLGNAAVIIELLENKPCHSTTVNLNNPTLSSQKNSSFIMYNCARISAIFKEFEKRVANQTYPNLPDVTEINFDLLSEPEEWELLYVFVLQFPSIVKSCIQEISLGKCNPHFIIKFLSSLSSSFSVYYRRVRLLTDPRSHLFPVLFARIYLLKAIQQVFHNALFLLNIEPVNQM